MPKQNANYDFAKQKKAAKSIGQGSYANLPEEPMIKSFGFKPGYRDGIINDFTADIEGISDISENKR